MIVNSSSVLSHLQSGVLFFRGRFCEFLLKENLLRSAKAFSALKTASRVNTSHETTVIRKCSPDDRRIPGARATRVISVDLPAKPNKPCGWAVGTSRWTVNQPSDRRNGGSRVWLNYRKGYLRYSLPLLCSPSHSPPPALIGERRELFRDVCLKGSPRARLMLMQYSGVYSPAGYPN